MTKKPLIKKKYNKKQHRIVNNSLKPRKDIPEIKFNVDTSKITGICPLCSKNTFQDPSNILIENQVFHFDCIVSSIKENNKIEENYKIIYMGSNTFGIFWEDKFGKKIELIKKITLDKEIKDNVKTNP